MQKSCELSQRLFAKRDEADVDDFMLLMFFKYLLETENILKPPPKWMKLDGIYEYPKAALDNLNKMKEESNKNTMIGHMASYIFSQKEHFPNGLQDTQQNFFKDIF